MNKYLIALKKNVCSICCDSDEKGKCTLNNDEFCSIEIHIDQIVEVIHSSDNKNYQILYKNLKETVCKNCKAKTENGYCSVKEDANCSLERYFYLIVDIINKVDAGLIQ
ncbi:MAG: hypothetical protein V1773_11045 [bacterium]